MLKNLTALWSKCHTYNFCRQVYRMFTRGTQRRFPPKYVENTIQAIQKLLLDLWKCIRSGATKFLSVRSSQGNLSLFEITRASVFFSENFRRNLTFYESKNFSDSSLHHILESENFRFPFSKKNSVTWVVKYEKLNFRKSQGIYQISFENCT